MGELLCHELNTMLTLALNIVFNLSNAANTPTKSAIARPSRKASKGMR